MAYVDYTYYTETYGSSVIPSASFAKYERKAENKINLATFNRISESGAYMNDVRMCTCEVAEKIYAVDTEKVKRDGLKSYSNDGESGTYDDMTEDETVKKEVDSIISEYLLMTGLLYRGCY